MLIVRRMQEEDIEAIAQIEAETFTDAWTVQGIRDTFRQKHALITVAELEGEVIGYCILYYVLDEGEIARIAMAPGTRGKGFGKQLLGFTAKQCAQLQVTRLLLDVRESNATARAFYSAFGFQEDGIRKCFYENPQEDAVLMSASISCDW